MSDEAKTHVVSGTALNAKAGAVVKSDHGAYYIDGLSAWPDNVYNKKVEVKGRLVVLNHSAAQLKDEDGDWVQGMRGEQRILKDAQWSVVP